MATGVPAKTSLFANCAFESARAEIHKYRINDPCISLAYRCPITLIETVIPCFVILLHGGKSDDKRNGPVATTICTFHRVRVASVTRGKFNAKT